MNPQSPTMNTSIGNAPVPSDPMAQQATFNSLSAFSSRLSVISKKGFLLIADR
jgi:hypothetical protein